MTPESLARGNEIVQLLANIENALAVNLQPAIAQFPELIPAQLLADQVTARQQALIDMRTALQAEFAAL